MIYTTMDNFDIINFGLMPDHNYELLNYIPKDVLSLMPLLPFQIDFLSDRLDWSIISSKYLPGWLFVKYADKIDWNTFILNGKAKSIVHLKMVKEHLLAHSSLFNNIYTRSMYYNNDFAAALPELIHWNWFCKNYQIDHHLILKYWDEMNSRYICEFQQLTLPIIKAKYDSINWEALSGNKYLTESIIDAYPDKFDWIKICKYKKLPMGFIEKHKKRCISYHISRYQDLTEQFMAVNANWLDWTAISEFQSLSFEFIQQYADRIFMEHLSKNKNYNKPGTIQVWYSGDNWHVTENSIITTRDKILFYADPLIVDKDFN